MSLITGSNDGIHEAAVIITVISHTIATCQDQIYSDRIVKGCDKTRSSGRLSIMRRMHQRVISLIYSVLTPFLLRLPGGAALMVGGTVEDAE